MRKAKKSLDTIEKEKLKKEERKIEKAKEKFEKLKKLSKY